MEVPDPARGGEVVSGSWTESRFEMRTWPWRCLVWRERNQASVLHATELDGTGSRQMECMACAFHPRKFSKEPTAASCEEPERSQRNTEKDTGPC